MIQILESILGKKIELLPKVPKENEKLCEICDGVGWLQDTQQGYIEKCRNCYDGIIMLCHYCGKPTMGLCNSPECRTEIEQEIEDMKYERAIKCSYAECPDCRKIMMYSDSYGYNEGYFVGFDELIDYCESEDIPVPDYCWSTTQIDMSMDAESLIENACQNLYDGAEDHISDEDRKELQDFLDRWCEKQSNTSTYSVDYKYAIKIEK